MMAFAKWLQQWQVVDCLVVGGKNQVNVGVWLGLTCVGLFTCWWKKQFWVTVRNFVAQFSLLWGVPNVTQFMVGELKSPKINKWPFNFENSEIRELRLLIFSIVPLGDLNMHEIWSRSLFKNLIYWKGLVSKEKIKLPFLRVFDNPLSKYLAF